MNPLYGLSIFGAMAKKAKDLMEVQGDVIIETTPLIAGFIAAFVVGIFACRAMIALVRKSKLRYFAWYCIIVAITGMFLQYV